MRVGKIAAGAVVLAMMAVPVACSKKSSSTDAFCDVVEEQYEMVSTANLQDPDLDTDQLQNAMDEMNNAAPDELQDDLALLSDLMSSYIEAGDSPEAQASLATDFDLEAVSAAGENVDTYIAENCEIEGLSS